MLSSNFKAGAGVGGHVGREGGREKGGEARFSTLAVLFSHVRKRSPPRVVRQ